MRNDVVDTLELSDDDRRGERADIKAAIRTVMRQLSEPSYCAAPGCHATAAAVINAVTMPRVLCATHLHEWRRAKPAERTALLARYEVRLSR